MKVILRQDVSGTGEIDDVVNVAAGYARNYLLPHKLAIAATPQALAKVDGRQAEKAKRQAEKIVEFEALAAKLNALVLTIPADIGEEGKLFGSVTVHDLAEGIKAAGLDIDKRKLDLGQPLKLAGEHKVMIRLYRDIQATITVNVVAR